MDTNILERVEGRRGVLDVTRPRVDVLRFKVDGYLELGVPPVGVLDETRGRQGAG